MTNKQTTNKQMKSTTNTVVAELALFSHAITALITGAAGHKDKLKTFEVTAELASDYDARKKRARLDRRNALSRARRLARKVAQEEVTLHTPHTPQSLTEGSRHSTGN